MEEIVYNVPPTLFTPRKSLLRARFLTGEIWSNAEDNGGLTNKLNKETAMTEETAKLVVVQASLIFLASYDDLRSTRTLRWLDSLASYDVVEDDGGSGRKLVIAVVGRCHGPDRIRSLGRVLHAPADAFADHHLFKPGATYLVELDDVTPNLGTAIELATIIDTGDVAAVALQHIWLDNAISLFISLGVFYRIPLELP